MTDRRHSSTMRRSVRAVRPSGLAEDPVAKPARCFAGGWPPRRRAGESGRRSGAYPAHPAYPLCDVPAPRGPPPSPEPCADPALRGSTTSYPPRLGRCPDSLVWPLEGDPHQGRHRILCQPACQPPDDRHTTPGGCLLHTGFCQLDLGFLSLREEKSTITRQLSRETPVAAGRCRLAAFRAPSRLGRAREAGGGVVA
jgi:hypothetical protein